MNTNLKHTSSSQPYSRLQSTFEFFVTSFCYLTLMFSTPIAFFTSSIALFVLAFFYPSNATRYALGICIIISGCISFGDVPFISDVVGYYGAYQRLLYDDLFNAIFSFNSGIEFIVPLYWTLWTFIFGDMDSLSFMFLNALSIASLFYLWLEMYEVKKFDKKEAAFCVFLALFMFYYYMSTHLLRQLYSTIFILFALSQTSKPKMLIFVAIGFCCHVTAPIFFAIFYLLRYHYKIGLWIIGLGCVLLSTGSFLPLVFSYVSFIPDFLTSKLPYYVGYVEKFSPYNIKTIILIGIILVGLHYRHKIDPAWRWIIIGYAMFLLCAQIGLVHLLHRFSSIYLYIPLGYFLFLVLRTDKHLLILGSLIAIVSKMYVFYLQLKRDYPEREWSLFNHGFGGEWFYYLLQ